VPREEYWPSSSSQICSHPETWRSSQCGAWNWNYASAAASTAYTTVWCLWQWEGHVCCSRVV